MLVLGTGMSGDIGNRVDFYVIEYTNEIGTLTLRLA